MTCRTEQTPAAGQCLKKKVYNVIKYPFGPGVIFFGLGAPTFAKLIHKIKQKLRTETRNSHKRQLSNTVLESYFDSITDLIEKNLKKQKIMKGQFSSL